jgi:hypothetical protein
VKIRSALPAVATAALPAGHAEAEPAFGAGTDPSATVTGTSSDAPSETPTDALTSPAPTDASTSPAPTDTSTSPAPTDTSTSPAPTDSTPAHDDFVNSVGNYWHDHWKLQLVAGGPNPVASITAHYRLQGAPADAPEAGTSTDFVREPFYGSSWITDSAVSLPQVGVYDVSVDVTDSQGNTEHFPDAGQFTYSAKVHVGALSASRTSVDYDHRVYTLSAAVTVTDPGTGAALDPTGVVVALADPTYNGSTTAKGTVGADGRLSVTVNARGTSQFDQVSSEGSTAAYPYFFGGTPPTGVTVPAVQQQTRVRILSGYDVDVPKGGHTTIRGVLERKSGASWLPASGQKVWYGVGGYSDGTTAPTAADGTFQVVAGTAGFYYFATYWNYDPFLQSTDTNNAPVHVHIPVPTSIPRFTTTEDEFGEALIDGHIYIGGATFARNTASVQIQYSSDNKNWHKVGTTKIGRNDLNDDEFKCYATYGGKSNGYWRAYYPGSPDMQASYSKSVKIWRTPTKVTGGKPDHTTVHRNSVVHFGGHVYQQSTAGAWSPVKYSYAYLLFRPYNSKTWKYVTRVKTDSKGAYHLSGKATGGGTWVVVWYTPDSKHIDSSGPETYVHA